MREAVASALAARGAIENARVLELWAGTGALSFEMLSRGASWALLVERDRRMARAIEAAARELGLSDRVDVMVLDLAIGPGRVSKAVARAGGEPATLVLADPPYADVDRVVPLVTALAGAGAVAAGATLVLEHAFRSPPSDIAGLATVTRYRYGDTAVVMATVTGAP